MNVYIDGQQKGKQATTWPGTTPWTGNGANIGRNNNDAYYFFKGIIDDVRIYARSLTAQEVKEQYLAGVEKLYANGAIDEEEYQARLVAIANERVE